MCGYVKAGCVSNNSNKKVGRPMNVHLHVVKCCAMMNRGPSIPKFCTPP